MSNDGASEVACLDHAEAVRASLERAVSSVPFATADRLRRFLRYIVEKSLAHEADALKEYAIGVAVYGRKPDFDPRVDAIVRVEASRLRGKLREYYQSAGREDPIRIELPKGAYAPVFSPKAEQSQVLKTHNDPGSAPEQVSQRPKLSWLAILVGAAAGSFWGWTAYQDRPRTTTNSVAVLPFVSLSLTTEEEAFVGDLTRDITDTLTRVRDLQVVPNGSVLKFKNRMDTPAAIGRRLKVRTVLDGSVRREGGRLRITAELVHVANGSSLWSEAWEANSTSADARHEIAAKVVRRLQPGLGAKEN